MEPTEPTMDTVGDEIWSEACQSDYQTEEGGHQLMDTSGKDALLEEGRSREQWHDLPELSFELT